MIALATALWLGVLTSFSPCPLATNIAAVGWLTGTGASPRRVVIAGLLYGLGRAIAYAVLGGLLTASLLSAVGTSRFLQHELNRVLGPLLILVGMVLLDLVPLRLPGGLDLESRGRWLVARTGSVGALLLGALFALSFCPVSAALFFGSLLPLATAEASPWIVPAVYGLGTAVPVLALAVTLAFGVNLVGRVVRKAAVVEKWVRKGTGVVFVGAGGYLAWVYVVRPGMGW
jgi:cytochrome c-type biogenesis protein